MILKLIGMIILGVLSAALSYYKRNVYVDVFDDILGKDEPDQETVRVGRGFLYGFFFPIYFVLLLTGAIALVIFLLVAAALAAVGFVIVWVTEKIIPHEWFGNVITKVFSAIGLTRPEAKEELSFSNTTAGPPPGAGPTTPAGDSAENAPAGDEASESKPNPDAGINVTRKHTLD
jgi:hypothetical protein